MPSGRASFPGFASLLMPAPRMVLVRERVFPHLQKVALTVASGIRPVVSLPPMARGVWVVRAGGMANSGGVTANTAIDFLALNGLSSAQVVGRARLVTDQNDNVPALISNISNAPVWFELRFWPGVDDRLHCQGISWGGMAPQFSGQTFAAQLGLPNETGVSTADVVDGPIDLAILAVTGTSGAFTLDFVHVLEYPAAEEMWF